VAGGVKHGAVAAHGYSGVRGLEIAKGVVNANFGNPHSGGGQPFFYAGRENNGFFSFGIIKKRNAFYPFHAATSLAWKIRPLFQRALAELASEFSGLTRILRLKPSA
jgi:hypothetical protein